MKLHSSSSSSMSSACSSSVSTDQNMRTPKNCSTASCLARVLRLILCSRALPTHPFDHISEQVSESGEKDQVMGKMEEAVSAPLVARLMGLPTVPDTTNPCPVRISRSVNLTDCREQDCALKQGKHNSRPSVANMPVFIELENEEFIVFRFGNKKPRKKAGLKQRNSEENRGNGTSIEAQVRSKKERHLEFEDDSFQDSSPVSVLDFDQFTACQGVAKTVTGEEREAEDSNIESHPAGSHEDLVETSNSSIRERESWRGSESEEAICRLVEEEVKQSSWLSSKRFEIEEVAADCGMALLDTLLDEILLQSP